jgi:hypothetical protein
MGIESKLKLRTFYDRTEAAPQVKRTAKKKAMMR